MSQPVLIMALQRNYKAALLASWGDMSHVLTSQLTLEKAALSNSIPFQVQTNDVIALIPNLAV